MKNNNSLLESSYSGREETADVRRYATIPGDAHIQTVEVNEDVIKFNWRIKKYMHYADYGTAKVNVPGRYEYDSYSVSCVKFHGEDCSQQKIEVIFRKKE